MLPLSQTAGYAIRLLRCLEGPGGQRVLVETVAECTQISRAYLAKIAVNLAKKGIVRSQRGHHGGVVLARPAHEITLEEVSAAVDGTAWRSRCLLGLAGCTEATPCVLHSSWQQTREDILDRLRGVTVADMARHHDPGVAACIALRSGGTPGQRGRHPAR